MDEGKRGLTFPAIVATAANIAVAAAFLLRQQQPHGWASWELKLVSHLLISPLTTYQVQGYACSGKGS